VELARYLVDAVVVEKRTVGMWPAPTGSPRAGSQKLVARYKEGGYEAISARSKAAIRVANRSSDELDDRVVRLRKELIDEGFDAGAHTIHYHLGLTDPSARSVPNGSPVRGSLPEPSLRNSRVSWVSSLLISS